MERKAEHNIVRDVIRAYWNTLSADKLIKKYDEMTDDEKMYWEWKRTHNMCAYFKVISPYEGVRKRGLRNKIHCF